MSLILTRLTDSIIITSTHVAVTKGSSPGVSCPRPHRGSRMMFTLGAQKVAPAWPPLKHSHRNTYEYKHNIDDERKGHAGRT